VIEVLHPGLLSTVQDLGRQGFGHLGVPQAGAADTYSLRIANRLVGNLDSAPALEMTGEGARLRFEEDTSIAFSGGTLAPLLDSEPVPMHQTLRVKAGTDLVCGRVLDGWRGYLAVAGGIRGPGVMGSASSDTLAGLGPPPLSPGDRLIIGKHADVAPAFYFRTPPRYTAAMVRLRVLPGPQQDWFAPAALLVLREATYKVSARSDRTGVRLDGTALARVRQDELPSMGMATGALQVPNTGQPIALLANHGTTGGYPVIACIVTADLPLLAQLAPGAELRFTDVSRGEALAALQEQEARLERDLISADAALLAARALMQLAGNHASLQQAAVNTGKVRVRIRK
jgi:biotin-dependent carboxylase-like uncharacterized protein